MEWRGVCVRKRSTNSVTVTLVHNKKAGSASPQRAPSLLWCSAEQPSNRTVVQQDGSAAARGEPRGDKVAKRQVTAEQGSDVE
ncbi:hypothetical protein B9T62_00075 [Paenibacillus donghaensis]|uniref:Uncharacterized protein n=1 Tax=Paenibacillus donghaensis TaxID=414771 RepID=A0A2Z2KLB1_9BACL|nr:hypothetical protein B9T62_00075 [Paenibacillus donghaensis]